MSVGSRISGGYPGGACGVNMGGGNDGSKSSGSRSAGSSSLNLALFFGLGPDASEDFFIADFSFLCVPTCLAVALVSEIMLGGTSRF